MYCEDMYALARLLPMVLSICTDDSSVVRIYFEIDTDAAFIYGKMHMITGL